MFPHVPIQAITLDLADTHSISLTVDRILNDSIYIPREGGGAEEEEEEEEDAMPLPAASEHNSEGSTLSHPSSRRGSGATSQATSQYHTFTALPHAQPVPETDLKDSHDLKDGPFPHVDESLHSKDTGEVQEPPHDASSHTLQEAHDSDIPADAAVPLPELRLRKPTTNAADTIKVARAIESGEDSKDSTLSSENSFPSTSTDGYSQLFSSLQERKAELMRRAKR